MARLTFPLLPLILYFLYFSGQTESATAAPSSFIKSKCSKTTYPSLCVQSLSVYAPTIQKSPRQLALTALSVSLERAQSTQTFVKKLAKFKGLTKREIGAIKDCLEEMSDDVDRLSKAVSELNKYGKANGKDFRFHMSNVETWVSAALTDGNTCADGFAGSYMNGRIKTSIRARVTHVAQVTSNALALVNQYAAMY